MESRTKRGRTWLRLTVYFIGIVVLSLGIVLNTKTSMGVSAIISVPFSISDIWGWNLGNVTFFFYVFCIFMQWVLDRSTFRIWDLLQILVSYVTSWFINLFDQAIPMAPDHWGIRLGVLALAITATGVGSALMVMMDLVANPADGLAKAMGKLVKREFGFGKNMLDLSCVTTAAIIGLVFGGKIVGIGLGTVCSAIFIGRCIALTNYLFKSPIRKAAGL